MYLNGRARQLLNCDASYDTSLRQPHTNIELDAKFQNVAAFDGRFQENATFFPPRDEWLL